MNIDSQTLLLIVVVIAAVAVLLQAGVLLGILIALLKTSKMISAKAEEFHTSTIPVLQRSHELLQATHSIVTRLEPRFDSAAADIAEISRTAREQVGRLDLAANDLHERLHRHTVRLDAMATGVLDAIENTGNFIGDKLRRPKRHVSHAFAVAKAFVKGYSAPVPEQPAPVEREPEDISTPS